VIYITRSFIEPPERAADELPAAELQAAPVVERPARQERLEYPDLGIA